ncbi:substrate-binding domain-containing protein [Ruficoccus amylovorans]|uniref:Substrate-binding domain-containing protein n=1 Tax=Ruficoccus amylovorans TaxID=1804625 RepID=A0A842HHB8_9BACT|nr:substrate-binding domain-containing protein [Ruficoccus amylovorans]MBC2595719.1 substrate-binding domain-containing protein [Ruficoccus amylovorans]
MKKPSLPERLAIALLIEIASGNYHPDTRFLSRREIMHHWKVSSPTATQSLSLLAEWGILSACGRSGHYLEKHFMRKALLRIKKSHAEPLPGRPQWENKVRASMQPDSRLRRIAVIVVSDCSAPETDNPAPDGIPGHLPSVTRAVCAGIFEEMEAEGATADFYFDDGLDETRERVVRDIERARPQGVIVVRRLLSTAVSPVVQPLLKAGLPVVTAFDDCERLRMVSVNFNNVGLGYSAAQHLIEAGHRHIAVLVPPEKDEPYYFRGRLHGCKLAAREIGQGRVTVTPLTVSLERRKPAKSVMSLLDKQNPDRVTALFATTVDGLAALEPSLDATGIRVPEDMSVIMCSSRQGLTPGGRPFDIMKLDFRRIGQQAFRALERVHEGSFAEKVWLVDAEYEPCGTVAPLRGEGRPHS